MFPTWNPPAAPAIRWPDGKTFAFTIFDDPDAQTLEGGERIYGFLADLGVRTTRGVWPSPATRTPNSGGETCGNRKYRVHNRHLQEQGFEIGYHNNTKHSSYRSEIIQGLDAFRDHFGTDPSSMANHYNMDAIYWGPARLSPPIRQVYTAVTLGRTERHFGHVDGHPAFWGDVCRSRIRYCRNFVFADANTLAACPWMPYHDPERPYVNAWYASSEGSNVIRFRRTLAERNQDRLAAEGGACIMYTHFGHGFVVDGALDSGFRDLMIRLSRMNGWFVPVTTLLDYLRAQRNDATIQPRDRAQLERRWLQEKMWRGTS